MIKFANVSTLLPTPEVEEFISQHLDPEWSRYFYDASHGPEAGAYAPTVPKLNWQRTFKPRINSLIWPTGASRWASMLLLVTDEQLAYILADATTTTSGGPGEETTRPNAAQLVLTDADYTGTPADDAFTRETIEGDPGNRVALSTQMFALDPRPVSVPYSYQYNEEDEVWEWVASTDRTLWVLPIVDERWFWQWVDVGRVEDEWTWENILVHLALKLSQTSPREEDGLFEVDSISEYYCSPIEFYANYHYANAAALMDAVAHSVGQRVSRRIDGTVRSITPITAGARWNTNLDETPETASSTEAVWQRIAGDSYGRVNKAPATVPESFQVVFQDDFAQTITADEAGSVEWGASGTRATIHVIGNGDGCNKHDFALQAAGDYIDWLARKADVTYAGIKCWEMTGFEDVVVWSIDPARGITTRVVTHPENLAMTPVGGNNTEILYALPACDGVGIPAATDQTHPGKALCCLFWLKLDSDTEGYSPADRVIRPLKRDGHNVRAWVYNPYPVPAKDCDYLPVGRMPSGSLTLLSSPPEVCAFATTTTSTTSTTNSGTTTSRGVGRECQTKSRCKMVWNESARVWAKESGCENTTTTSTTTSTTTTAEGATTSSTTSSTTTPCACPVSTTTSTTTSGAGTTSTTTSSTTTGNCQCQIPTFCGTEDGQCTYTYCSTDKPGPQICSTTTSTTTTNPVEGCNCATTCSPRTTVNPADPPPPSCTQCGYERPGYGAARFINGCSGSTCICPTWALGSIDPCSSKFVDCQRVYPTQPPTPPCTGDCVWWPIDGLYWLLGSSTCSGPSGCGCSAPNSDPPTGCPGPTITGCAVPNPPTTGAGTTPPPNCCVLCNTTTPSPTSTTSTTTSTTTTGCGSKCRWSNDRAGGWSVDYNPCPSSCPCSKPGLPPEGPDCEIAETPCGTGSTTTSTSSTTSSTTSTSTTTTTTTTTTTSTTTSTTTTVDPCNGLGNETTCGETPGCFWNGVSCNAINCAVCEDLATQAICDQCPSCTWTPLGGCN